MHHIYLGVGNSKDALIEIGLSDITHAVEHFNIVIIPKRSILPEDAFDFSPARVSVQHGIPVCEWTWDKPSAYYTNEELDLHIFIGTNHLTAYLGESKPITSIIAAERVRFGIDSNNVIRAIQVFDLLPPELANIKLAFPSS